MPGLPPPVPVMVGVLHRAAASRFMAPVSRPAPTSLGGQVHPGERQEAHLWPSGPSSYSQAGGILPTSRLQPCPGAWEGDGHQAVLQCCPRGAVERTPCLWHRLPLCKGMGSGWDPGPGSRSAGSLVLPSQQPPGAAPSWRGVSAPGEQGWACGAGDRQGGLEQAKTPGCPRANGYETPPKE